MEQPKTEAEAMIYYIQMMDLEMIELILKSDTRLESFNVERFIQSMSIRFQYLNKEKVLQAFPGFCNSNICDNCCNPGYLFLAPINRRYFSLLFNTDNGKVWDIYECFDFKIFNKQLNLEDYYLVSSLDKSYFDYDDSEDPF